GYRGTQLLENDLDRKPIIHRKTQFFATREALQGMAMLPGAARYTAHNCAILARAGSQADTTNAEDVLEALRPMYEAARKTLPADLRSRSIYYLTRGSLNHDPRGFMLDGEVLLIVSSAWALQGYLDFIGLVGETTWIAEQ